MLDDLHQALLGICLALPFEPCYGSGTGVHSLVVGRTTFVQPFAAEADSLSCHCLLPISLKTSIDLPHA